MAEMTIFDRLKLDHENHRRWFAQIMDTQGDSQERRELFKTLKDDTTAHAAAEEEVFYTYALGETDLREQSRDGVSEHMEIAQLFIELDDMDFGSTGWLNRFRTLKDKYMHHIDEEDEEKFVDAEKKLSKAEALRMADEFEKRKPQEMERAKKGIDEKEIRKEMEEHG